MLLLQVACVCRTLQLNADGERLVAFFGDQPLVPRWQTLNFESTIDAAHVFIAQLFALHYRGRHNEARDYIRSARVDATFHGELQQVGKTGA